MHILFTQWMNFFARAYDTYCAYDCVNPYAAIFLCVYDMFHILLSCDSLKNLWIVCMYVREKDLSF